ncbi:uroporphyrinogen-III C-methyltransferase [Paenibacillus sp.]|jgi:uroporphyrinogen III methyltransferase/synthase|uniref:uroporphyrinogen-III C-methyltransferase n=1 Tax=Paenibacillus sp. TaxID=58172 RepID=UPI00282E8B5F|nr:uroporphyrinogen-III C-methyltransferase [Paenibacillus sp.]MDR0267742.1 uroporphyrinogen-III C-methyltransferase [Paenibacillus sp.]
MAGKVYLVGAGPGHAKLITVKGLECLQKADVVVYDRLAAPQLLGAVKPDTRKIYVGKLPDRHTMKQEEINQLLVDLALEGNTVVRLKGGDPTIFGRVGEEAGLLKQHGIAYEIIPGVTAAISVPAYAGIPVTHRDMASSVSIITGHESPDKLDHMIDWEKVTNATGTLVFMMGVSKIGYIADQLMRYGRSGHTPVALVRWGTRAEQDTLTGTLEDIEQRVIAANFQAPAVIVVGDVVLQREQLMWAEFLPLFGKRILVTRTRSQAPELVNRIDELGGESYEFPVIETVYPQEQGLLTRIHDSFSRLDHYDWVFFTSVNGVEYFYRHLAEQGRDIRSLAHAKVAAVGPATAEALKMRGIVPVELPRFFQAEGMIESLGSQLLSGQKVLLPRGDLGRAWLPEKLADMGLDVTVVDIYQTVLSQDEDHELVKLFEEGAIHVITFTSSSTVTNLIEKMKRMGVQDPVRLLRTAEAACIGEVTAKTAREAGLRVSVVAEEATINGLVDSLCSYMNDQRKQVIKE